MGKGASMCWASAREPRRTPPWSWSYWKTSWRGASIRSRNACLSLMALRAAINAVFGAHHPVQRCRAHKLRNVLDHLPEDQKDQVKSLMRAAWKMEAKAGVTRIRKLAEWLEREYPR